MVIKSLHAIRRGTTIVYYYTGIDVVHSKGHNPAQTLSASEVEPSFSSSCAVFLSLKIEFLSIQKRILVRMKGVSIYNQVDHKTNFSYHNVWMSLSTKIEQITGRCRWCRYSLPLRSLMDKKTNISIKVTLKQ